MKESTPYDCIVESADTEMHHEFSVRYILTRKIADGRQSYSIQAICNVTGESACLCDITSVESSARTIFKRLSEGAVTPFCLAETAEDLIESVLEDNALGEPKLQ